RRSAIPAWLAVVVGCAALLALVAAAQPARAPGRLYFIVKDDKWGYIDETGRLVVAPQFDDAGEFREGRARVSVQGKPRYIDTAGRFINTPPFDVGGDFAEGLAPVNTGQQRIPSIGIISNPGRWGYINQTGALVIPMTFQLADEFHEGLAAAHQGHISGFIDHTGRFRITAPFDVSWGFSEGVVLVKS